MLHHMLLGQTQHQVQVQGRHRKWGRRDDPGRRMPDLREDDPVQREISSSGRATRRRQQEVHRHRSRRDTRSQFIQGKTITQVID